jgi:ribonuclease HI
VQNQALRLITGGVTTTPIDATQIELNTKSEANLQNYFPQDEWVRFNTEGSYHGNTKRAGYGVYCIFFKDATPMSTCRFDAEVAAIETASKRIAETSIFLLNKANFIILSDSVSAIQLVNNTANLHPTAMHFIKSLSTLWQQNKELRIHSHCEIVFVV